jgi:quercetin dioxygenase-like cupin family protein
MQKALIVLAAAALAAGLSVPAAAESKSHGHAAGHVMFAPAEARWADGPPSLPKGAKFQTLEGDPQKEGLFTMRLWLPSGYRVPAHWHPADEHVTVISGTFHMGMGDKLDTSAGKTLPAGSFVVMPAGSRHFAYVNEETVVQLHGMGPWGINYVNPADDPRGAGKAPASPKKR